MICGRAPLAFALLSVCVEAPRAPTRGVAPRAPAPAFGPAPPPPGLAKTDFHLLAELESHWLAGLVLAVSLAFIIEHRPAQIFGEKPARSRDLVSTATDGTLHQTPAQTGTALQTGAKEILPWLETILLNLTPVLKLVLQALMWLIILLSPLIRLVAIAVWNIYLILPKNILRMIYGLVLCFFGGTFVTTLAAAEAFNALGGQKVIPDFILVIEAGVTAWEASHKEEKVGMLGGAQSTMSRTHKAMVAIKKPEDLQTSIGACLAISMAVLSTLRIQFAQTTALAVGIVSIVKVPIVRLFEPAVGYLLGDDLEHWVDTMIDIALKSVALAVAWHIQMGVSAFYSGIRGGTLFAYGLMRLLHVHGKQATYMDELLGYPLAAYGFYWQVTNFFTLPHPWNMVLLPIEMIEWALRWTITYSNTH